MKQLLLSNKIYLGTAKDFHTKSLLELKGKRILLFLTSTGAKRLKLQKWLILLDNISLLTWIKEISPNPTSDDIYNILSNSKKEYDIAVAIGGGSTIDIAKACITLFYLKDLKLLTREIVLSCIKTKEYLKTRKTILLYAIPTTAGTGSEVTHWATIWNNKEGVKYSVDTPYLYPDKTYLIPEYTATMSRRLTLSTGLDALCQAVEAYWAKTTNSMVKILSKNAIELIIEYLPKVLSDTKNLHYREKVFMGSLFSGLAFSNTRTTACHSISYPLTIKYGIEHGLACIITLPKVLEINMPEIEEIDELFKALRVDSPKELQNWLDEIIGDILKLRLSTFGIKQDNIDELVKMAYTRGRMDNNPVIITPKDVKNILLSLI